MWVCERAFRVWMSFGEQSSNAHCTILRFLREGARSEQRIVAAVFGRFGIADGIMDFEWIKLHAKCIVECLKLRCATTSFASLRICLRMVSFVLRWILCWLLRKRDGLLFFLSFRGNRFGFLRTQRWNCCARICGKHKNGFQWDRKYRLDKLNAIETVDFKYQFENELVDAYVCWLGAFVSHSRQFKCQNIAG